jgi:Co/Zn/Cd efflux system component
VSLQADALDFFGDAANYGLSLSVLSLALAWRARAALVKGVSMGLFGVWVIGAAVASVLAGGTPHAATMGGVGFAALVANVGVAVMLYRYRDGDANMRSVWLCTRNDALGNVAVMLAALGVFGTGSLWPDVAVAAVMASLALSAAGQTITSALRELRTGVVVPHPAHDHAH